MFRETIRLIRDGEGVGRRREIIYLSLYCHHQNDSCIKMGREEIFFFIFSSINCEGQSHKTITFEEKGEQKRNRTEVLLLTSLTPYR